MFTLQMYFAHGFPSSLAFSKGCLKAMSESGLQYVLRLMFLHGI